MSLPEPPFSLAAGNSTQEAGQLELDFQHIALIRRNRGLGATWTMIGAAEGKPPKLAKRDAKRLTRSTRRSWYLHHNQEDAD